MSKTLVVGAGHLGSYWALILARSGWQVQLTDTDSSTLASAAHRIEDWYHQLKDQGLEGDAPFSTLLPRIAPVPPEDVNVDEVVWMIECINENEDLKGRCLAHWEDKLPRETYLLSNTSLLLASQLAKHLKDTSRFAVLHLYQLSSLGDLVPTRECSGGAKRAMADLLNNIDHQWVQPALEIEGFALNRLCDAATSELLRQHHIGEVGGLELDQAWQEVQQQQLGARWSSLLRRMELIGEATQGLGIALILERHRNHLSPQRQAFYDFIKELPRVWTTGNHQTKPHQLRFLLCAWLSEALILNAKGHYDYRDIDRCWMITHRAKLGPFAHMDVVGLPKVLRWMMGYARSLSDLYGEDDNGVLQVQLAKEHLKNWIHSERVGVATGRGFYNYPNPEYESPRFRRDQHHPTLPHQPGSIRHWELPIDSLCVCNMYYEDLDMLVGKFVVVFNPPGITDPVSLVSMEVNGPDGYHHTIEVNAEFSGQTWSGWQTFHNDTLWYQSFDRRGPLKDGTYTLRVCYRSGREIMYSRDFQWDDALLRAWKATTMHFSPEGSIEASDVLALNWTTLDLDAHYAARFFLMKEEGTKKRITLKEDLIFRLSQEDREGLNRDGYVVNHALVPQQRYGWNVEILDSNHLESITTALYLRVIELQA